MQHGSKTEYTIEVGNNNKVEVTVKAFTGCAVCWDTNSVPGNHHLAGKCHLLQKANTERAKSGMDPIIVVSKMAVSMTKDRAKLSLD